MNTGKFPIHAYNCNGLHEILKINLPYHYTNFKSYPISSPVQLYPVPTSVPRKILKKDKLFRRLFHYGSRVHTLVPPRAAWIDVFGDNSSRIFFIERILRVLVLFINYKYILDFEFIILYYNRRTNFVIDHYTLSGRVGMVQVRMLPN